MIKVKELIELLQTIDPELPVYRWRSGGEFYELPEEELRLFDLMASNNTFDPYVARADDPFFNKGNFRKSFGPAFKAAVIY